MVVHTNKELKEYFDKNLQDCRQMELHLNLFFMEQFANKESLDHLDYMVEAHWDIEICI